MIEKIETSNLQVCRSNGETHLCIRVAGRKILDGLFSGDIAVFLVTENARESFAISQTEKVESGEGEQKQEQEES